MMYLNCWKYPKTHSTPGWLDSYRNVKNVARNRHFNALRNVTNFAVDFDNCVHKKY